MTTKVKTPKLTKAEKKLKLEAEQKEYFDCVTHIQLLLEKAKITYSHINPVKKCNTFYFDTRDTLTMKQLEDLAVLFKTKAINIVPSYYNDGGGCSCCSSGYEYLEIRVENYKKEKND